MRRTEFVLHFVAGPWSGDYGCMDRGVIYTFCVKQFLGRGSLSFVGMGDDLRTTKRTWRKDRIGRVKD